MASRHRARDEEEGGFGECVCVGEQARVCVCSCDLAFIFINLSFFNSLPPSGEERISERPAHTRAQYIKQIKPDNNKLSLTLKNNKKKRSVKVWNYRACVALLWPEIWATAGSIFSCQQPVCFICKYFHFPRLCFNLDIVTNRDDDSQNVYASQCYANQCQKG